MKSQLKTLTKTLVTVLCTATFLFFTACGGSETPPPNTNAIAPQSQESFKQLLKKLTELKQGKCDKMGIGIIAVLTQVSQMKNALGQSLDSLKNVKDDSCDNHLREIVWIASHILMQNGQPWINQPSSQTWLRNQIALSMNRYIPYISQTGQNPQTFLQRFGPALMAFANSYVSRLGLPPGQVASHMTPNRPW